MFLNPLRRRLCVLAALATISAAGAQTTWVVGPDGSPMSFQQALARAQDGDTIDVMPGLYKGQVGVITQRRLTIRGGRPRPVFDADGKYAEGKAIWVVKDGEVEIDHVELRGARVPDGNGAGLRLEKGKLLLKGSRLADNQNGLLSSNDADTELSVVDSEFSSAPREVGSLPHLLYVGRIGKLTVTGSRFHAGFEGHLIKSRARVTRVAYNLIYDGPGGEASYEIDLPNGGDAVVIGNLIGQSRNTQNPVMIAYGAEGKAWDRNRLLLSHNTLYSDALLTWFLRSWPEKLTPDTEIRAVNNLTLGLGLFSLASAGRFSGNWPALDRMLVDPSTLAFRLRPGALLRGRADDPRQLAGDDAVPAAEFVLPIGTQPLPPPAAWTPGAFQR